MNSYILKNESNQDDILLYEEKKSYSFTPKNVTKVKRITVLDPEMLNGILESKIIKKYNTLVKMITDIISSEDTSEGDILAAFTEIKRIRQYLISLVNCLDKALLKKYLDKIALLETKLKRYQMLIINNYYQYSNEFEIGRGGR